ncbi:MAG: sialate O-acetylesterase, partial [Chitinophagaceae bacterium]|nr:sialate O-acetylesterase [Chitinophagaceae bacterium]
MRSITIAILIQLIITPVLSQSNLQLPIVNDVQFTNYYHQRVNHFNLHPVDTNDIIFVGNSITDGAEWTELFHDQNIKNRGISGDISAGILNRIGAIVKCRPKKIFLMIGTNDLARGISADSVIKNILLTVAFIKQESPSTQVFIQSILPVSNE